MIRLTGEVEKLKNGGVIGNERSINNWAKNSFLQLKYYHYSPNRDKIIRNGFVIGAESYYDGIYFADDSEWSKPFGNGKPPIVVRINVSKDKYVDLSSPTKDQLKNIQEWYLEWYLENDGKELGDPGTLGPFMSDYGYQVWSDGIQIGVMDPNVIGIIEDR